MNTPLSDCGLGRAVDRVDGRLKVTGQARYAAEFTARRMVHAVAINSAIAAGTVRHIDAHAAEHLPGVLAVLTHHNAPRMPAPEKETPQNRFSRAVPVLQSNQIHHHGQFIGLVVAETLEQARHAARQVKVTYDASMPAIAFDAHAGSAYAPPMVNAGHPTDTSRGDVAQGLAASAAMVDATYDTPIEHHHPMEMHATLAAWDGDHVTVYNSLQMVVEAVPTIAASFEVPRENVRVLSPYVGGGFGCKILTRENAVLAILAARVVRRPVKLMLTRQQMFMNVGLRQHNRQHVRLGADAQGRLQAVSHETLTHTSMTEEFVEQTGAMTRMLYATPNSLVTHRVFRLNVQTPKWTRGPGEVPGSFALECAMDELAQSLRMDPVELRLRNDTATDPDSGRPFSSRALAQCLRVGAERFGWSRRPLAARATRHVTHDGRWHVGYGMAASSRGAPWRGASARVTLQRQGRDVRARVEMAATDIGTGSYTVVAQAAADVLGLPLDRIEVRLGDSSLPPTPGSGGSWGAGTFAVAAQAACRQAMSELRQRSRLNFVREPTAGELMQSAGVDAHTVTAVTRNPEPSKATHAHYAFGANFCEAWVDEDLGTVRIPRFTAAIAAGRIVNPKTARSQIHGGIVWGIGNALMEEGVLDTRDGSFITRTLADYHVPVNLDIGDIDVVFVPEDDTRVNALGIKGIGEIGIIGVAAAVANAVAHATGKRVRSLPITPDKLLDDGV